MRVALLCPYSLSRPGGVQGQVTGLAAALVAGGHEVAVLAPTDGRGRAPADGALPAPRTPGALERRPVVPDGGASDAVAAGGAAADRLAADGVQLVDLGPSLPVPANGSVAPLALRPGASRAAIRGLRAGAYDVLHLHEPLAPGPAWACLARGDLPMVGTFHRAGGSVGYRLLAPVARHWVNRLAARCAVSEEARRTAQRMLGGSYEVVGNGVDLERFRHARPYPTAGPTVLFVGRHERRKGLAVALDALERLGPDSELTLWVAGEGPETRSLRRRHPPSRRLEWLGRLGDQELAERLGGAHVVCVPSLAGESFGVVLLEAMATRCAVVASDLPGYASVVASHGTLVPPGDAGALAAVLADLAVEAAAGSGRCAPAALDAAAAHAERWAMPRVAHRYLEIYRRVVAVGPSA